MSSKPTDREVLDSLVRDAAATHAHNGMLPDAEGAQRYMAGVLEKLDKKQERARHKIAPKTAPKGNRASATKRLGAIEKEYARRGGGQLEGRFRIERRPAQAEKKIAQVTTKKQRMLKSMLRQRIRLLRSLPDWEAKFKQVNFLHLGGKYGEERRKKAIAAYDKIIEDSNRLFGPWWREQATKAWSNLPSSSTPK